VIHVLVTGGEGFIGRNLRLALGRVQETAVTSVDLGSSPEQLRSALATCDIVFHLAGVNRPQREEELEAGNLGALRELLAGLATAGRRPLVVLSSSIQAQLDNPYGRSKRHAEEALLEHARLTDTPARVFRLPNVFGKWCRPNYNSAVATFCHNLTRGLPITVSDASRELELVHVDDVVARLLELARPPATFSGVRFESVTPTFRVTLGRLVELLRSFQTSRETLLVPELADPFVRRLHSTYLSYLPSEGFAYHLQQRTDARGALAELLKGPSFGQLFVSRTRPGVTRGNHYHDGKVEKFVVLEGEAVIRLRHMTTGEDVSYAVEGREHKVVDIPPGWTHSIENVGSGELLVLFWASEILDPSRPDTHAAEVGRG
jgi:UDP-2-acetamido-2,6-beta-L-arabino-hexul-4-ose reductase